MPVQPLPLSIVLRYPKPARPQQPVMDGMPTFHHATRSNRVNDKMVILESGINAIAHIRTLDGPRRPAILIRSSPARAGTERTPWEDVLDIDAGVLTYFGDHKASTRGPLGSTKGNKALEMARPFFVATDAQRRALAPPLLVFITVPWIDRDGAVQEKGAVEFTGLAVLEKMIRIRAVDKKSGVAYPNYRTTLRLMDLSPEDSILDWNWVNARRSRETTTSELTALAPKAWRSWIELGEGSA